jgi:hypothetical protein
MPGFILHQGAVVLCAHGGQAMPTVPSPSVTVMGMSVTTFGAPWVVAGCPFVPPNPGPCVTAQWITSSLRVTCNGQPLLLLDSQALCIPTGTPLLIASTQTRVTAQ